MSRLNQAMRKGEEEKREREEERGQADQERSGGPRKCIAKMADLYRNQKVGKGEGWSEEGKRGRGGEGRVSKTSSWTGEV